MPDGSDGGKICGDREGKTHDEEREEIARAGQRRTLTEHTYYHRMQELVDIVQRYL
jgi:spore maturation protein CgeB